MKRLFLASILFCSYESLAQVPPPPPANSTTNLAEKISNSYKSHSLSSYEDSLSNDLIVTEDNNVVASNKKEWLKLVKEKIENTSIIIDVKEIYYKPQSFLAIEYINSVNTFPGNRVECCWETNAVKYFISGNHIDKIIIVTGGQKKERR